MIAFTNLTPDAQREVREIEARTNRRILTPLNARGHWRLYTVHQDDYYKIVTRTVCATGVDNGVVCYEPASMYVWEEESHGEPTGNGL